MNGRILIVVFLEAFDLFSQEKAHQMYQVITNNGAPGKSDFSPHTRRGIVVGFVGSTCNKIPYTSH